jgi:hypothetical protein
MEKKEKGHKRLTIAELRNCKGFENYSEEQSEETIRSLEKLSILFYELYIKQKQKEGNYSFNKKTIGNERTDETTNGKLKDKITATKKVGIDEGKTDHKKRNAA